ncbi:MAG: hypothetical protein ACRC3Y_12180 [Romboutsia sp.]|uniref:hypothetical protein n=1 Tax=Romboutsia sp. TaxID=1965302 RepID=UPI003F33DED0
MGLKKIELVFDYLVFALILYRLLSSLFTGRNDFLFIGVLGVVFISTHILKQILPYENKSVDIVSKVSCLSILFICLVSTK